MGTTVMGCMIMQRRTMSGLNGVLAGLAACGWTRMAVVEREEAKAPEELVLAPAV